MREQREYVLSSAPSGTPSGAADDTRHVGESPTGAAHLRISPSDMPPSRSAATPARGVGLPAVPSHPDGARNRLLHLLPADDYAWLAPHLTPVALPARRVLYTPGETVRDVYFPEAGGVSVINRLSTGRTVEVGTVGPEGLVGLSAVLDAASAPSETVVQVGGTGFRAPAAIVVEGFAERPALRCVLARYAQAYLIQVAQTAACNSVHPVDRRCARWLLMAHDRIDRAPTFELTHEFLAYMLAVRRASVSAATQALERAGVIRNGRGRVTVLDRDGLERAACECYGVVRREFDRLVGGETPAA
jgi:CRP-like cAMP-binding protein